MKEIWLPSWIILTNNRIIRGYLSSDALKKEKNGLRIILEREDEFPADYILPVADALMEMECPQKVAVN